MKHRSLQMAVFLLAAAFVLSACGGGGGGGGAAQQPAPKVQLSGTLSGGTGKSFSDVMHAPLFAVSADAVWAIPIAKMQGANIDPVNFMLRKTSAIGAGGSFSFSLEKSITMAEIVAKIPTMDTGGFPLNTVFDVDWLLVRMAGTTPLGVIRLAGDGTYDSMLTFPLSAYTASTMDLGSVSGGDATLTVSGIAGNVTLSSGSLAAIARADDILGTITDIIRNCDINTDKCYSAQQSYSITGVYSNISTTYDIAGNYQGYQIYFDVVDYFGKADFDAICPTSGLPTVEYTLAPPAPISVQTITYSSSSPLTTSLTVTGTQNPLNSGAQVECFKGSLPLYFRKDTSGNDWNLQFVTGDVASQLITEFPAGDWVLSRGTSTILPTPIASFSFSLTKPVDGSNKPIIIVPGVKLTTAPTDSNRITAVNVKWYQWNGTGYVQVTDTALLNSMLGGFELSLDDYNGKDGDFTRRSIQMNGIDFATASIDVSAPADGKGPFYYDYAGTSAYNLEYMGIGYQFGGQSFRFPWAKYIP